MSEPCDLLAANEETVILDRSASKALIITQTAAGPADIM